MSSPSGFADGLIRALFKENVQGVGFIERWIHWTEFAFSFLTLSEANKIYPVRNILYLPIVRRISAIWGPPLPPDYLESSLSENPNQKHWMEVLQTPTKHDKHTNFVIQQKPEGMRLLCEMKNLIINLSHPFISQNPSPVQPIPQIE